MPSVRAAPGDPAQVVEQGSAEAVLTAPRDPYTRALIAAVPHGRGRPARGTPPVSPPQLEIVFQDPFAALNPRRRIGEAIARGPMAYGVPKAQAVDEALTA